MGNGAILIAAAALVALPALAAIPEPSGITARLRAPADEEPAFMLSGSGVYVYECKASGVGANEFAWYLVAPDATLYEGSRSAGRLATPGLYESLGDRTSVSGIVHSSQGAGAGNLPWVLIRAQPMGESEGMFKGVTSIQRVNTNGGAPPGRACGATIAGSQQSIAYNADYYFYKKRGAS